MVTSHPRGSLRDEGTRVRVYPETLALLMPHRVKRAELLRVPVRRVTFDEVIADLARRVKA